MTNRKTAFGHVVQCGIDGRVTHDAGFGGIVARSQSDVQFSFNYLSDSFLPLYTGFDGTTDSLSDDSRTTDYGSYQD